MQTQLDTTKIIASAADLYDSITPEAWNDIKTCGDDARQRAMAFRFAVWSKRLRAVHLLLAAEIDDGELPTGGTDAAEMISAGTLADAFDRYSVRLERFAAVVSE